MSASTNNPPPLRQIRNRTFESGPPYPLERYIDLSGTGDEPYLECRRFSVILGYRNPENVPPNYTPTAPEVVWSRKWLHSGGRMAGGAEATAPGPFDSPYVRA